MEWSGFTYLNKHSWRDMGVSVASRSIGSPNKIKLKVRPPFSNTDYDFSEIYGAQTYENRYLKYQFNIAGRRIRTKEDMNWVAQNLTNWLMNSKGKQPLYDDHFRGYHFMAEVEEGTELEENWSDGTLDVTFVAYPFKISNIFEGNDEWDLFDFDNGVTQDISGLLPSSAGTTFTPLSVGDKVIVGAWVQLTAKTPSEGATPINYQYSNRPYTIKTVNTHTPSGTGDISYRSYTLDDGVEVLEQDIIQAHPNPLIFNIRNPGLNHIYPSIELWNPVLTVFAGITIAKGNMFYHYGLDTINDTLKLHPGGNSMIVYGFDTGVRFDFKREMI